MFDVASAMASIRTYRRYNLGSRSFCIIKVPLDRDIDRTFEHQWGLCLGQSAWYSWNYILYRMFPGAPWSR